MAPTEILAFQHYEDFSKRMKGVSIVLLTSSINDKEKAKELIRNGKADIVIGTHSLFYEDVMFKNLGLVIADEQQRFGVNQRKLLRQKGEKCDLLLMSATPIPRTLASAVYGDKDVSVIETLPKGRKGCRTYLIRKNSISDKLDEIKEELKKGRQIYIVCASIDKNDEYKAKDVNGIYDSLINVLKPYKLGLLHGKMSSEDKNRVMKEFADNEINVLVCTTVVEVGISVANATMMIIYDADRFGLSQLHQLRGRVQRGNIEGSCYLLTDSKDDRVIERLNVLCKTNNGFEICSLEWSSQKQKQDLAKYGIVNNKTYLPMHLPKFTNDNLILAFILGYFDGDGSISVDKNYHLRFRLCAHRPELLEDIALYLSKKYNCSYSLSQDKRQLWELSISTKYAKQIFKDLYSLNSIRLDRKYQKYLEYINHETMTSLL